LQKLTMRQGRAVCLGIAVILCAVGIAAGSEKGAAEPAQRKVQTETGRLTQAEENTLRRIKSFYEDFVYGPNVRRYFYVNPETRSKTYLHNELLLKKVDGLIAGQYVSYRVEFDPELNVVNYWFDAGTAFRGWGAILVSDESLTRSEWACGMTSCDLRVQVNGKTVYGPH
jgi:hypothetical protein